MIPDENVTPASDDVPINEDLLPGAHGGFPAPKRTIWKIGSLTYTRRSLATLFGWLLWGDFAWQMRDRAVAPVAQLLLKHLKASDFFIGLLVGSIPSALGMIISPILSTVSDRWRGPLGRRIPFLLLQTPFTVLALIGLGCTPLISRGVNDMLGASSPGIGPVSLGVFAVCWTIFEIAATSTQSIFYGLVNDVVPHELVGRAFGLFRAASLFAGILFNHYVIGHAEQHYREIFIAVGILYGVGLVTMSFRVKEGTYPPPKPHVKTPRRDVIGPVITYFKETFSNPHYVWIYAATTIANLAPGPVNAFSILYAKSVGLGVKPYGDYLALTYAISFCLAYILGSLADRFHPLRIVIVSIGLYATATVLGGIFATTPAAFAIFFVAHGVLSGCLFTSLVPTYQLLFPKARFGEFYSATTLLMGLASALLPPLVGRMLDISGHVYRLTFVASGVIGVIGFVLMLIVYGQFMRLGGPKGYVPPD